MKKHYIIGISVLTILLNNLVNVQAKPKPIHRLSGIKVSQSIIKGFEGDKKPITVTAIFSDGKKEILKKGVTWKVVNTKVAAVNDSNINIISEGNTRITAQYQKYWAYIDLKAYSSQTIDGRTEKDIINKWLIIKPKYVKNPYAVEPKLSAPYKAGILNPTFLNNGLNMLNFVRYVANVPCDVIMDNSLNEQAQYGAVLLYANGSLDHYPPQPKNMDKNFYDIGYKSTNSSNISQGCYSISDSILSYMSDSDYSNIDRVGHRRWLINPQLNKIGFGYAGNFSSTQVFDRSRKEKFDYDYISWPSKGFFPTNTFNGEDAWSISLNPEKYQVPNIDSVKVTLTSCSTGKSWVFNKSNNVLKDNSSYLNVETSGYGISNCIIFRPSYSYNNSNLYSHGKVFKVSIDGIKDIDNKNVNITYYTHFFDLE